MVETRAQGKELRIFSAADLRIETLRVGLCWTVYYRGRDLISWAVTKSTTECARATSSFSINLMSNWYSAVSPRACYRMSSPWCCLEWLASDPVDVRDQWTSAVASPTLPRSMFGETRDQRREKVIKKFPEVLLLWGLLCLFSSHGPMRKACQSPGLLATGF